MAKDIEPKLKLISEYLSLVEDEIFLIPEYQRGYSWEVQQCDKLWQDIEAFIDSDAKEPYFFGTIIMDCSDSDKLSLIDGQQRTTTFLLLLKALLLRLNEAIKTLPHDEEVEPLKAGLKSHRDKIMAILYKAEAEDIPSMLKDHSKTKGILILENKSINEMYKEELVKIIESEDFDDAESVVKKIPRKQKDNRYTNHFRNFKFFYNKLKDEKSDSGQLNKFAKVLLKLCQVIEIRSWKVEQAITMFNSLNSTGLPLSDSDIISAQLYSNAGEKRALFDSQWGMIKKFVARLESRKILSIDGVLQQYMYINRAVSREYLKSNEDGSVSVNVTTPGLRKYYMSSDSALLTKPIEFCNELMRIVKRWDMVKDYPLVKLVLKSNENAKLFLAGYLYRFELNQISEEKVSEICDCLLRLFTVNEISDFGYSSSKFKTFLYEENAKLVDANVSEAEIKNDFNLHLKKHWNANDLDEMIENYNKNFLVFINEYVYAKNNGCRFDFADNVNIEHIMPASGHNIVSIQKNAGIESKDEFDSLVNKIGNKILLEEDINKSIGNDWFQTKKQTSVEEKTGYKNSRYALAVSLVNYPKNNWIKEDINAATKKAIVRIRNFILGE